MNFEQYNIIYAFRSTLYNICLLLINDKLVDIFLFWYRIT